MNEDRRSARRQWLRVIPVAGALCSMLAGAEAAAARLDEETLAERIRLTTAPALAVLRERPYLLPPLAGDEAMVHVRVRFKERGARILREFLPAGRTEGLDRLLAGRRTTGPRYWLFVLDPAATHVMWWAPVDDPRRGVVETVDDGAIVAHPFERARAEVWVRVPFVAHGRIAVLDARSGDDLDLASFASQVLFQISCDHPPPILVMGDADDPRRKNVVFVPDGFAAGDLHLFPSVVQALLDAMLEDRLVDRLSCAFNFWRIDVPSSSSGIDTSRCADRASCPAEPIKDGDVPASHPDAPPWPFLPMPPATLFGLFCQPPPQQFGSRHCQGLGLECEYVWPDDQGTAAWAYAEECAGDAFTLDFLVLVANSTTYGGGGFPGGKVAVTTLDGLADGTIENLAVHELGHALGLLDEYDGSNTTCSAAFGCGGGWYGERNVFHCPDLGSSSACPAPPWNCSPPEANACVPPEFKGCEVVRQGCAGGAPEVGLYEGAFCSTQCFYRASGSCRMRLMGAEFCRACDSWVKKLLWPEDGWPCWAKLPIEERWVERYWRFGGSPLIEGLCATTPHVRHGRARGALHALVESGDLIGEVPVRSLEVELGRPSGEERTERFVLGRARGDDGSGRWSWTIDRGRWAHDVDCSSLPDVDPRRARLIDDVGGQSWKLLELRWSGEAAVEGKAARP